MVLQPLEFSECFADSPQFRDKLHSHEKELERTSKSIKVLIKECTELLTAENRKFFFTKKSYIFINIFLLLVIKKYLLFNFMK